MNDKLSHLVILEVKDPTRWFPGELALNQVDFDVRTGEVHALVGENGASKIENSLQSLILSTNNHAEITLQLSQEGERKKTCGQKI